MNQSYLRMMKKRGISFILTVDSIRERETSSLNGHREMQFLVKICGQFRLTSALERNTGAGTKLLRIKYDVIYSFFHPPSNEPIKHNIGRLMSTGTT